MAASEHKNSVERANKARPTKREMVHHLGQKNGMTDGAAKALVNDFTAIVRESLVNDGAFYWPGIGTLKVTALSARRSRNPQTGEPVEVPAKKTVRFRPNPRLKASLQEEAGKGSD
jgi:DNA-binding protein HU-beta